MFARVILTYAIVHMFRAFKIAFTPKTHRTHIMLEPPNLNVCMRPIFFTGKQRSRFSLANNVLFFNVCPETFSKL